MVDPTTYTEVDPNNRLTVDSTSITITGASRNDGYTYLRLDYGAAHFNEDYSFLCKYNVTQGGNWSGLELFSLSNTTTATQEAFYDSPRHFFRLLYNGSYITVFYELTDADSLYQSTTVAFSGATDYWMTLIRDEAVGTYGTHYHYVYSDADRTVLVGTGTLALHEKIDFQYNFLSQNIRTGDSANYMDGVEADITITPPIVSAVVAKVKSWLGVSSKMQLRR